MVAAAPEAVLTVMVCDPPLAVAGCSIAFQTWGGVLAAGEPNRQPCSHSVWLLPSMPEHELHWVPLVRMAPFEHIWSEAGLGLAVRVSG
jgi:hypothetical protein